MSHRSLHVAILAAMGISTAFGSPQSRDRDAALLLEELDVRLVIVEAVVTGADETPVVGLQREDFELWQGQRQLDITHFAAVTPWRAMSPQDGLRRQRDGVPAEENVFLAVYVDRRYLEPGDLGVLLSDLGTYLANGLGSSDRVMLITADRSLDIRHAFTSSALSLVAELDLLQQEAGWGDDIRSEYGQILGEIERRLAMANDQPSQDPYAVAAALLGRIESFAAEVQGGLRASTERLHRLIDSIAGLPGRRVILYIGGRFPVGAGESLFRAWEEVFGNRSYRAMQLEESTEQGSSGSSDGIFGAIPSGIAAAELTPLIDEVSEHANLAGVTFNVIDASGLRGSVDFLSSQSGAAPRLTAANPMLSVGHRQALASLSRHTGGSALLGNETSPESWSKVAGLLKSYYSLAFVPPPTDEGELHRLEVRLRAPYSGLSIRHRKEYAVKSRDRVSSERTISTLLFGEAHNPLDVELQLDRPSAARKGMKSGRLTIKMPLERLALVADGDRHLGRLSLFVTSGGFTQGVAPMRKAVVQMRIPNEELLTALGRTVEYSLEIQFESGSEAIAVGVRDDFAPLLATAILPLTDDAPPPGSSRAVSE